MKSTSGRVLPFPLTLWLFAAAGIGLALFAVGRPAPHALALSNCTVDASVDSQERELLRLINEYRQQNGRRSLVFSESLIRSAAWKSKDLAVRDYFAHEDAVVGRAWPDRLRDCGFRLNTFLGETIAAGDATPAGTLDTWRSSPTHDAELLGENWVAIGIGRYYLASSSYGWYWTADFAGAFEGKGDVNCDGVIGALDASLILQRLASLLPSLSCGSEADADSSGQVDSRDASIVLQFNAGLLS